MKRPATVHVESKLNAPCELIWDAMQRLSTFEFVTRGILGAPGLRREERLAEPGLSDSAWIFLFHAIPLHRHTIEIVEVDEAAGTIRTREHGGMVKAWLHTLRVQPAADGQSVYSDTVEIDAGTFTPLVAASAKALYGYRHRRWHKLVRQLQGTESAG